MNDKLKKYCIWTVIMIVATLWLIVVSSPFLFMVLSAFKKQMEILKSGVFTLPEAFYLGNFKEIITGNFMMYFRNSVVVVLISLSVLLFTSSCASYALARFKFPLNKPIFALVVAAMAVPIHVTLIPVFILTKNIGIYDSIFALMGPYIAFNTPISVFILTSFMADIPLELEEAANMDGCGKYKMFYKIMLPLSKPGLATLGIYNSINMWNEFSYALVLTQSLENRTLPLAIWEYQGEYSMNTPMIMAVLALSVLPMIIAFIIGQDKLIKGMMAGAVKG